MSFCILHILTYSVIRVIIDNTRSHDRKISMYTKFTYICKTIYFRASHSTGYGPSILFSSQILMMDMFLGLRTYTMF